MRSDDRVGITPYSNILVARYVYLYTSPLTVCSHRGIELYHRYIYIVYIGPLIKYPTGDLSCHSLDKTSGFTHNLSNELIHLRIVYSTVYGVILHCIRHIDMNAQRHLIVIAYRPFLFQHTMIGMKPETSKKNKTIGNLHNKKKLKEDSHDDVLLLFMLDFLWMIIRNGWHHS